MADGTEAPLIPTEAEDVPILDNGGPVPVVYADGVLGLEIHGAVTRITYFEYRMVSGARMRCPVLEMVRPTATCGNGKVAELVAAKRGDGDGRGH